MSIYVAIACVGIDEELPKTISSCISHAENPNDIIIGVSMVGEFDFYNNVKKQFINNKNVKIIFNEYPGNVGVGVGRKLALLQYNNEDYVMQIDAHSRMAPLWDTYLINKFNTAKKIVNNKKIILTGYPARYYYNRNDDGTFIEHFFEQYLGINIWREQEYYKMNVIPTWGHTDIYNLLPMTRDMLNTTGIVPAAKICAAFMFSDKFFIENNFLDEGKLFWEEELVQSIEFIYNGFTLVYPGQHAVVSHLYTGDIIYPPLGERHNVYDVFKKIGKEPHVLDQEILYNYNKYMNDPINKAKIKLFEKYNNFSFKKIIHDLTTYPSDYINVNKNPI